MIDSPNKENMCEKRKRTAGEGKRIRRKKHQINQEARDVFYPNKEISLNSKVF